MRKKKKPDYKRKIVRLEEGLEAVFIEIPPGASTPIHDHGESEGQTMVVEGYPTEETWNMDNPRLYSTRSYVPTQVFHETPRTIHRISNRTSERVLLMAYYRPRLKMRFYTAEDLRKMADAKSPQ